MRVSQRINHNTLQNNFTIILSIYPYLAELSDYGFKAQWAQWTRGISVAHTLPILFIQLPSQSKELVCSMPLKVTISDTIVNILCPYTTFTKGLFFWYYYLLILLRVNLM